MKMSKLLKYKTFRGKTYIHVEYKESLISFANLYVSIRRTLVGCHILVSWRPRGIGCLIHPREHLRWRGNKLRREWRSMR